MAPLLTFYGDDFTGSSAVMEVLAFAGLPTVMFLDVPSPTLLDRLQGRKAYGIAGISRSKSPDWMSAELPRYFTALKALGAPLMHYKTCSTFDSAPYLGSIGRAIEIGLASTGQDWTPLVVGAPAIGRYQMFGTLFAALDGMVHRLDRHPIMSRHPATPMAEADLCRHLDQQTDLPKAVIDWRTLLAGKGHDAVAQARQSGASILALDAFDGATLAATGKILWDLAEREGVFATGSQGVEYALVAHWQKAGLAAEAPANTSLQAALPLLVVSGSCSQITARQIATAAQEGFHIVPVDATAALHEDSWAAECARSAREIEMALSQGRNTLACTARGPEDPAIAALNTALDHSLVNPQIVHARIGSGLGQLVRQARQTAGLKRAIFSGGDTSGHAMLAVGAEALEPLARLAPGVPLMRVSSTNAQMDGMEVALKGGQMGESSLFVRAARGD